MLGGRLPATVCQQSGFRESVLPAHANVRHVPDVDIAPQDFGVTPEEPGRGFEIEGGHFPSFSFAFMARMANAQSSSSSSRIVYSASQLPP